MQNFDLLKEVGQTRKPVLLKRGMSATVKDLLMSRNTFSQRGTRTWCWCERGVRSFEDSTRNMLDMSAVPNVKGQSHLPIIVDPSHATGRPDLIPSMSRAALAAGADAFTSRSTVVRKGAVRSPAQRSATAQVCTSAAYWCGRAPCGPSDSAFSGQLWTSDVNAVGAGGEGGTRHGWDQSGRPVAWLGSTMIGKWLWPLTLARRSCRACCASSPRTTAPRARTAPRSGSPLRECIRRHEQVFHRGAHARFSSTGLRVWPTSLSRSKFCMLRAPTWNIVGVSVYQIDLARVHHLGHHRQPVPVAHVAENAQPFLAEALETVRAGAAA